MTSGKCLILDDDFQELSIQRKTFSQRMLNDIKRNDSPSLDYCIKHLRRDPDTFPQSIHILIETKHDIVDSLLSTS